MFDLMLAAMQVEGDKANTFQAAAIVFFLFIVFPMFYILYGFAIGVAVVWSHFTSPKKPK